MKILVEAEMARFASFRTGGKADVLLVAERKEDIPLAFAFCRERGVAPVILGGGTNVLISDKGIRGVCLLIRTRGIRADGTYLTAAAGERLPTVARTALNAGLSGLEFASGIPGTAGGAAVINAGAFGGAVCDVCEYVEVFDGEGFRRIAAADCGFGYRTSRLKGLVVSEVRFFLTPAPVAEIEERMREFAARRRATQPALPSAGSVYKATPLGAAGLLIDRLGLKGMRVGGAAVSSVHANFIVNTGGANSANVLELMERIEEIVYTEYGIVLEREVELYGEF